MLKFLPSFRTLDNQESGKTAEKLRDEWYQVIFVYVGITVIITAVCMYIVYTMLCIYPLRNIIVKV